MSTLNDELFAMRISFQDSLMDEINIIKELKIYLKNKNESDNNINNILVEFYKSFNIDFSLEFISSVIPTPIIILNPNNIASFLLNGQNHIDSIINSEVINNADSDEDSDDDVLNQVDNDSDDDVLNETDNESNEDVEEEILNNTNQIFNNLLHLPPSNSFFSVSYNNGQTTFNNGQQNFNNNIPQFGNLNTSSNPEDFINNFTNLLSSMNLQNLNSMEDVRVTLDDNALEGIKSEVLKEDLPDKCSICIMDLKKGEKYSKLQCNHGFHTECVMKWLKEYNYKCPVCREECGQAKYHI